MYSTALRDLTGPLLDFQNLAKLLAKRWRDYAVDRKKKDCRKVLGLLRRAVTEVKPTHDGTKSKEEENEAPAPMTDDDADFDWSKLGFETSEPTTEINGMGFLGLLDFASFVQRDTESFNKVHLFEIQADHVDGPRTTRETKSPEMSPCQNLSSNNIYPVRPIRTLHCNRHSLPLLLHYHHRNHQRPRPRRSLPAPLPTMAPHPLVRSKILPPSLARHRRRRSRRLPESSKPNARALHQGRRARDPGSRNLRRRKGDGNPLRGLAHVTQGTNGFARTGTADCVGQTVGVVGWSVEEGGGGVYSGAEG